MEIRPPSIRLVLSVALISTVLGCGSKKAAPVRGKAAAGVHHHHDHGAIHGPHGGNVVGLDTEDYHAEVTLDSPANRVGVYILGDDAMTTVPIEEKSIAIDVKEYEKSAQYVLPAVSQAEDAVGKSSYFEIVDEALAAVVAGQSQDPNAQVRLIVNLAGSAHTGYVDTHNVSEAIAHGHGPAADDALVWLQEVSEQGFDIAVGHHGHTLLAGGKVEPAVQITRDGQPVSDAKVFNALLAEDGKTILHEEVATVYEPPTAGEPSHYAQAVFTIPSGTRNLVIRYRIVLPNSQGERTIDMPVGIK
jgi:hypothetical protein